VPDSLFRFGTGLGKLDRINRRADPSCSGSPAVNLSQENPTIPWVRLSKIEYYHSDNLSTIRLSDVKHAVNKKRRFGRVVCALANDATMGATSSTKKKCVGHSAKNPHGRFTLENSENSQVSDQENGARAGTSPGPSPNEAE